MMGVRFHSIMRFSPSLGPLDRHQKHRRPLPDHKTLGEHTKKKQERKGKETPKNRWTRNDTTTGPFARRAVGIKSPKVPARPAGKLKFDLPMG